MRFVFIIFLSYFFSAPSVNAQEVIVNIVTEDAYPLQYMDKNEVSGPTTALVKAMLEHADISYKIKMMPWARAYQIALKEPNTLIYSIARNDDREPHFQWIGRIFELEYYLVGLDSLSLAQPMTLASVKHLRVGAIRDSATYQYLKEQGFSNLHVLDRAEQMINMLKSSRIDLFPVNYSVLKPVCAKLNISCQDISAKIKLIQPSTSLYLALSQSTDPKLVERLRHSYQHIMQ